MAEETPAAPEAPAKKSNMKPVIMVVVILVVEAVGIVGAMKMLGGGGAQPVSAVEVESHDESSEDDKIVEVKVLDARMPNNKTGVTYVYSTEIYVQVKTKHQEQIEEEVDQFQNEIKSDLTAIWRTAEPQYFQEPKLESLTRKVYALLNERFGQDKEKNQPIVSKVVIVMSTGFRIDS